MKKLFSLFLVVLCLLALVGCSDDEFELYVNEAYANSDKNVHKYETQNENICWGANQVELSSLDSNAVEIYIGTVDVVDENDEGFCENVRSFKRRIDLIGTSYAFAYTGTYGNTVYITISPDPLGLPVFELLNMDSSGEIVSQMKDFHVYNVNNFAYSKNADGEYEITIKLDSYNSEKLEEYAKTHDGENLYFTIGDLVVSSAKISSDMSSDTLVFKGLPFMSSKNTAEQYEFFMRLLNTLMSDPYAEGFFPEFPTTIKDNSIRYGMEYITPTDESVINKLLSINENISFLREGIENNIIITLDLNSSQNSVAEILDEAQKVYTECSFDEGAYSSVILRWQIGNANAYNVLVFTKQDGKMNLLSPSDAEVLEGVKTHPFFSTYLEQ